MYDEYNTLVKNGTWLLVLRPAGVNMVRSMWLFKHKFHADGTLSRYKARLVANGSSQQLGVDFDETFSPVVKPATIRTVLSLAVSRQWPIHQLDVKNAFLNGDLSETVYMHQPPGFVDNRYPHHVCLLQRSLYGLKQAPRAWFQRFAGYATRAGFYHSRCDSSLFIYRQGSQVAYLLIYVDDIILTASCPALLQQIIGSLNNEFDMTDLGALNYFLGISADRTPTGLFLSQKKYALQLLERAHMVTCNPSRTPVDTESKLGPEGAPVQDPTLYRSLAGGLQYLTFTRPDLSYAVQQICLYMHDPREPHLAALKRILRYVQGTLDLGLHLYASSTTSLVGYTDADWAGCPSTRRSTSGYCVFLGDNLLSWSAKRQHTLSRSSAEAEYRGVANVVAETAWLRNLLRELHSPLSTATLVYCDNVSAVYMSANPVQHQRTKHIEIVIVNRVGNVYVQFTEEEYAAKALKKLTRRYYAGRRLLNHELHDKKPSSDCERENDNKPSLDYERENVSSDDERRLSGGDVFGKKIESVLRTDEDHDNRLIMDEVKPSGGDEKVELVTKTDENVGVGSVSEKDKLQVDEDLEWDEIGDIGENDEKHVTKGGSLKKDEVSKRLNSGDDDEDLSWDTEDDDDDEPVKTGPVMIELPLTRPTEDGTASEDILVVIPGWFLRLDKCSLPNTPAAARDPQDAWANKKKRGSAPKEHSKRRMDVIG
ncbi:ribonuclease H-like domain-containing protein [Tanacetum coccineum]|uniref:Ribonuclease H-like domain-containing protein n=1 Tax=Tanacetum coccineum TaxID=301880 RepID=A0ABQ5F0R4_9ASTR